MNKKIRFLNKIKKIPYGYYCYTRFNNRNNRKSYIHLVKPCPYFRWMIDKNGEKEGYCIYLRERDFMLDDRCKICGIRLDYK